jgi:ribosomal protein S18 acetylase RimI-like enzyme
MIAVTLRPLTERDFEPITSRVDDWWGRPIRDVLQRLFFEHFQAMSRVAEDAGVLAGFLIGFQSQTDPAIAYAHFIGVDPLYRKHGLGRTLYESFFAEARVRGCSAVEAITAPVNKASVAFHGRLGFRVLPGDAEVDGIAVLRDHSGPGKHRVRMRRDLPAATNP